MKMVKKYAKEKAYDSSIGPSTNEEAREIHKGIYDGFVKVWNPKKFADRVWSFKEQPFEEFQANEKHYYLPVFAACFALKYLALTVSLSVFPEIAGYL